MITYGIDLHGTLGSWNQKRELDRSIYFGLLSQLMASWVKRGERVFVVSGPPTETIKNELMGLGLKHGTHYHQILSVVDHLKTKEVEMWQDSYGKWWAKPETWNSAKGELAKIYKIDIIVDDQLEYSEAMPEFTSFVLVSNE